MIITGFLIFAYFEQPSTEGLAIDWRFRLVIHDTSRQANLTLPANIGVSGGQWFNHTLDALGPPGFAPLSTRDTSSTIYIQAKVCCPAFTFGDFFNIWGQVYNASCVGLGLSGLYCAGRQDDPRIRYVDSDNSDSWTPGERVVYDANNNGTYDVGEAVIAVSSPAPGAFLKDDRRIYYVDNANYNVWDPGESVVYDVSSDAAYNANDLGIAYVDANGNQTWDQGESIVYDNNGDAAYQTGEPVILGAAPANSTSLRISLKTRFVDINGDNVWNATETVAWDANDSLAYDASDQLLYGSEPSVGTLFWKEHVIAGPIPRSETSLIRPPPFMSDGEQERCLQNWGLSNAKDWIIIIWSTLGVASCHPGQFG